MRPERFCGASVSLQQQVLIQTLVQRYPRLSLNELAYTVCELLRWQRANGTLKTLECRRYLERLDADGLIRLPARRTGRPRAAATSVPATAQGEWGTPVMGPLHALAPIRITAVNTEAQAATWREWVGRYHYLGYRTAFGASLRYFIQAGEPAKTLGCLQFSSPAWCMQARERWIGWSPPARKKNLQHIVNQSRFLILPWVKVPNLASHVLAAALRTVAPHWHERFGIEPLLLETLIDPQRFHGGCYRAANWIQTGLTTGRGRQDPHHQRHGQCPKLLFLYPLVPDARQRLQSLH